MLACLLSNSLAHLLTYLLPPSLTSTQRPTWFTSLVKFCLGLGALYAFLAVGLGAFGAHALGDHITPANLEIYKTGAQYQMYHALALLFVGLLPNAPKLAKAAGWLLAIGIPLFSGSLYILALTGQKLWGAVTPLGGLCFLAGWLCLVAYGFGRPKSDAP